jgi:hypothetical protein
VAPRLATYLLGTYAHKEDTMAREDKKKTGKKSVDEALSDEQLKKVSGGDGGTLLKPVTKVEGEATDDKHKEWIDI